MYLSEHSKNYIKSRGSYMVFKTLADIHFNFKKSYLCENIVSIKEKFC